MRPIRPFYPARPAVPAPGPNSCASSSGTFTATGPYDTNVTRVDVALFLSVAGSGGSPPTTREIPGGTATLDGTNWSYTFPVQFPVYPGDDKMPAVLIIKATTTDQGPMIVYVPFYCTLSPS